MAIISDGSDNAKRKTSIEKPSLQKLIAGRKVQNGSSLENPPQDSALKRSENNAVLKIRKRRITTDYECPLCTWEIRITHNTKPGDMILCKGCGAEYELHSINPIRLQPINFYNGFDEYPAIA